jgi:hypothetical protein
LAAPLVVNLLPILQGIPYNQALVALTLLAFPSGG